MNNATKQLIHKFMKANCTTFLWNKKIYTLAWNCYDFEFELLNYVSKFFYQKIVNF